MAAPDTGMSEQALSSADLGPDFACIGAMKGGTSWLHVNLRRHRDVWIPPVKELSYLNMRFGSDFGVAPTSAGPVSKAEAGIRHIRQQPGPLPERVARDLACHHDILREPVDDGWYARLFAHRRPGEMTGDVNPSYAILPEAGVAHAARMNPRMKLIALLRDPAERAFSHMVMHAGPGVDRGKLQAILQRSRWPLYVAHSDYARWLGRWRDAFGRDAIHIATLERIRSSPKDVLSGICAFLGIAPDDDAARDAHLPVMAAKVDASGLKGEFLPLIRERLAPQYEALARDWPEVAELFRPPATIPAQRAAP
jgi:hypothetical protein